MSAAMRVRFGKTGLMVSPIACGNWQASPLWGSVPDADLIAGARRAFELGVNFFDTAPTYGDGRGETLLGQALAGLPRGELVVCTKCYTQLRPDGKRVLDLSGASILKQCDASLARLRLDYVDLYLMHVHDPKADPADAAAAMAKLKAAGKIRAYGVSNHTVEQLRTALRFGDCGALQPVYNFTNTAAEGDLFPLCQAADVGVMVYSPLAKGLLSGKYRGDETFTDSRKGSAMFQGERFKATCAKVQSLAPMAAKYGLTIAQLVLAATLMHPAVHVAINGVKHPRQIEETVGAIGTRLSVEDYEDLRATLAG